jgi:hypothetical protein
LFQNNLIKEGGDYMEEGNDFGKSFNIKEVQFYFRHPKQEHGRTLILPVNWPIKIVRGRVWVVGSKVRISFPQAGREGFFGKLTAKNTFLAEVGLDTNGGNRGKISFCMKSPLFVQVPNSRVKLVSNKCTYAV